MSNLLSTRILSTCSRNIVLGIHKSGGCFLRNRYRFRVGIPFNIKNNVYVISETEDTEYLIHKFDTKNNKISCSSFPCKEDEFINTSHSKRRHYLNNITLPNKNGFPESLPETFNQNSSFTGCTLSMR